MGTTVGVIQGDTRSLDYGCYSSYEGYIGGMDKKMKF